MSLAWKIIRTQTQGRAVINFCSICMREKQLVVINFKPIHLVHQASLHQRVGVQFLRCYTTLSFSSITVSVFLFGICSQRTKIFITKSWDLLQGQQVNLWSDEIVLWNCSLIVMKIVAQSLSHVQLFASPWTAACQDYLSSWSLLKLMTIELGMPSNLSSFVVSLK